jgi:MoaA/NifB/PqqE/SkfB family radical SAM enzyme
MNRPPRLRALLERTVDRLLPSRVPVSPRYVQVEIINRCNLRCVMCAITELTRARPRKVLDRDQLAAIVKQLPALERVDLQGIGEPLLNPHLEEIISWCVARSLEVGFVTNGLLFDPDRIDAVLRARPSYVVFSVDSVDPEVFATIRPGADIATLLRTIELFVQRKRELELPGPHVGIMTIAMRHNLQGLPEVIGAAARLGVDGINIKGLNSRPNPDAAAPDEGIALDAVHQAVAQHPDLAVNVAFASDRKTLRCRWPWTAAYITAEGDLTPCCNCPDARDVHLGNLLTAPFASLWNATAYRRFRRELRSGMPEICRSCPDY